MVTLIINYYMYSNYPILDKKSSIYNLKSQMSLQLSIFFYNVNHFCDPSKKPKCQINL